MIVSRFDMSFLRAYHQQMKTFLYGSLCALWLVTQPAYAQQHTLTEIDPWPSERLPAPIPLKRCPGVAVIEWRPTPGFESTTAPTTQAITVLESACGIAYKNFRKFLKSKNLSTQSIAGFQQSICLMPARMDRGGNKVRNLNDANFRFSSREKSYTRDGKLYTILGYTHYENHSIYIGNDVLNDDGSTNRRFVTIFSHELFHAMAWYYEITKPIDDEEVARQFTEFLGLGR